MSEAYIVWAKSLWMLFFFYLRKRAEQKSEKIHAISKTAGAFKR